MVTPPDIEIDCASGVPVFMTVHTGEDGITQIIAREWGLPDVDGQQAVDRTITIDLSEAAMRQLFSSLGARLHLWDGSVGA